MYQAIIPYNISGDTNAITFTQIGIWQGGAAPGQYPWYVDNISVVPIVTPPPGQPLFITYDDFEPFTSSGGDLVQADNTWSATGDDTNGLGNTTAPGAIGTAGSLLLYWSSAETGWGDIATGPNEQNNGEFMQAIDPGCDTNSAVSVAAYGNIYMDFSMPDNSGGGNYFQVGIELSYAANGYNGYAPFWPSGTKDLGYQDDNGYEVYQATIPYTINAGNYYGFQPSIFVNSNYQPTNGFHIDNISVSASQAPLFTGVSLNGSSLTLQGTGGLAGGTFTLLETSNLLLPLSQWTVVSSGNVFTGPNWTITITINPASPATFYSIQALP